MGSISRTCKAAEFHTMSAAKRKVKRLVNNYARCPDAGEGEEQTLMALVTTEKMLKDAQAGVIVACLAITLCDTIKNR